MKDNIHEKESEVMRVVSTRPDDMWCYKYTLYRKENRGCAYFPIFNFPDLEDRVLKENWIVEDVMYHGIFRTFVKADIQLDKPIIRIDYSNGASRWVSMAQYQASAEFQGSIAEILLIPYHYIDEFNQDAISGQLAFMAVNVNKPYYVESYIESVDPVAQVNPSATSTTSEQLVGIINALGLTPKDAIKLLVEVI